MSSPIVSIIIPTKNSAATLSKCLESIKNQTYNHIEILIVDNFSHDMTPEIAKKYTKHFFSYGPERSTQRNFGVANAHGELVAIIDSDMKLSPGVIAECAEVMMGKSGIEGVVIPEESFGVGFWAKCKQLERSFYVGVPYMEAARFFRKSSFNKVGGYDSAMVSGEDWDLSQRIAKIGRIDRIKSYIYHNEGHITLIGTIKKKFYYAKAFRTYKHNSMASENISQQTGILGRYWLFFSKPKKLISHPIVAIGMLFMKTCEFGFGGAGYIFASLRSLR